MDQKAKSAYNTNDFLLFGVSRCRAGVIYLFRMIPQTELALWGSGVLKAGGRYIAPARRLDGAFSSPFSSHSNFAKKSGCGSNARVPPHAVLEPQPLYFRKVAVARMPLVF